MISLHLFFLPLPYPFPVAAKGLTLQKWEEEGGKSCSIFFLLHCQNKNNVLTFTGRRSKFSYFLLSMRSWSCEIADEFLVSLHGKILFFCGCVCAFPSTTTTTVLPRLANEIVISWERGRVFFLRFFPYFFFSRHVFYDFIIKGTFMAERTASSLWVLFFLFLLFFPNKKKDTWICSTSHAIHLRGKNWKRRREGGGERISPSNDAIMASPQRLVDAHLFWTHARRRRRRK